MRPSRSTISVLVRPSVLFFAVAALVALAMVALSAGPLSGKPNCEGDLETTGKEICTGGGSAPGTGTGGGGGRSVIEADPETGTGTFEGSGGTGAGTRETTTAGTAGRFTMTTSEEGVSATYSGTSHGSKGGGRCTWDSSVEEPAEPQCVGSPGFKPHF